MNKYDNYDNNTIRNPFQITPTVNHNEMVNPQRQMIYPGATGLRHQGMSMQPVNPHFQPNISAFMPFNQNYPGMVQTPFIVPSNQVCSQLISNQNFSQISPNIIRTNQLYNHVQPANMYHSTGEKINANNQSNFIFSHNYSMYPTSTQIQHHVSHIPNQISPHIQPQLHSQMAPNQIQNHYPVVQSNRQYLTYNTQTEKLPKQSSPLEIINPETKKSIDLASFKSDKENQKINKLDFRECPTDLNKHPIPCLNKTEFRNIDSGKNECLDIQDPHQFKSNGNHNNKNNEVVNEVENTKIHHIAQNNTSKSSEIDNNKFDDLGTNIELVEIELPLEISQCCQSLSIVSDNISIDEKSQILPEIIDNIFMDRTYDSINGNLQKLHVIEQFSRQSEDVLNEKHLNKFIYSRTDLIRIGKKPISRQKPKGLPVKEEFTEFIILDTPNNFPTLENVECMQSINQKFVKPHKTSQGGPISWRPLNMKNSHCYPKYINLGNTENVLARSDDGYVTCKQRIAAGEELSETEELIRQIKGILNKIVPQNFDQCLDDLVSLKIGTHEGMTCLVNELFFKAVKEEAYSVTFAKICSYLASIKADVSDHEIVTFRSVLLQKCQAMFTTPLEEQLEKVRQDWLLKASNEKPKTKALMESDVDEQIKKAKDRYYGNIRFIGELYLKGVLITKIICFCIDNLLTKENEADSLICLCKLLETCGAKLETEDKGKKKLNDSFKKLRQLSESILIETRVRFRILDIMEMRQKKWCLRKIQQEQKIQPKTLAEIKIDKELEEEKDYSSTLNRKNPSTWVADRRPSLPNVNKSRSHFAPKQLLVSCSNDSTTLGPQKRNWSIGSGATINSNVVENDKNRINKLKIKMNSDIRTRDIVYGLDSSDLIFNQVVEGCVTNSGNCILPIQSYSALNYQSRTSSENSSRSSSHSRSTPQISSKEKLPNSKLTQSISVEVQILSPNQLFKEYANTNDFCVESWNACVDKVEVVYRWLDSNFDTDCDNRASLSNLLSILINNNLMNKEDLLKAFFKLIDSLEDLIIDIGQSIWDSLSDYFIPFLANMELESIDIIESIFNFNDLKNFEDKNACIIYSLPWSMSNRIMKCSSLESYKYLFKNAIEIDNFEHLSSCERKLIFIISKNLFRAIKTVSQISVDSYLNWIVLKIAESFNCFSEIFFITLNWEEMFNQIQIDPSSATRFSECFKKLEFMSKNNEILKALYKISSESDQSTQGIFHIIKCLLVTNTFDIQTVLSWESTSQTSVPVPEKLKSVLSVIKNKSAFISDNSFESLLSFDESNNIFFNQLTLDHDYCTNSDSY